MAEVICQEHFGLFLQVCNLQVTASYTLESRTGTLQVNIEPSHQFGIIRVIIPLGGCRSSQIRS